VNDFHDMDLDENAYLIHHKSRLWLVETLNEKIFSTLKILHFFILKINDKGKMLYLSFFVQIMSK